MDLGRILAGAFFAICGLALGGLCIGEAIGIWFTNNTTISAVVAGELTDHPRAGAVWAFVAGAVIMLLLVHFADVFRLWRP
ncbi:MAG: hypothetical protein M0027_19310 [Candidatus Dormibacteraeota bacterium]|jgi:hypothetical protein|nr:hypothetical protein [Candidatus Dormibacteraeota bacterium]